MLADRIHDSKLAISGELTFNRRADKNCHESAYVMQQDVLIPTLTVRETLQYAADLRLRGDISKAERLQIAEEVILELGLKDAINNRIKYCSGGEKRRTSLGLQLLGNPSVLYCDESTTGLDSTSAYQLVTTLKALASKGRTVILTIHQPRSEIWTLFDRVLVLSQGSCVFSGERVACTDHFSSLGFPLPAFCNPAEHVIDIAAVDSRTIELETTSQARVNILKREWKSRSSDAYVKACADHAVLQTIDLGGKSTTTAAKGVSFARQVRVLTSRTFLVTIRDPLGLFGSFIEAVFMGVVMGYIFFQMDGSLGGIRSRLAALYTALGLQGYLILMYETYRMSLEIEIFDRERSEGVVSIAAFLLSRRIAKLIEDILVPVLFCVPFYFMAGFRNDPAQFLIFFAVILIHQFIAVIYATLSVAISRDFAIASLIVR